MIRKVIYQAAVITTGDYEVITSRHNLIILLGMKQQTRRQGKVDSQSQTFTVLEINYQKIGEGVAGVIINPTANIVTDNLLSQEGRTIFLLSKRTGG